MKRDWSDGYVADITYSHGYFHELAPSFLRFCLLVNGHACPSDGGSGYTYCELGYGQGVSANVHAAANPRGEFWGTDFNPDHALHAQQLAHQAGLNAHWLNLDFEAMVDHATPQFDFIVLHGVWSWVSAAAQHALVEFIRRKLKPGGVVFISYNVLPGWNAEKPLRDLLWLHSEHASPPDTPTPERIASALQFAQALRKHGCGFFTENAHAGRALDDMLRHDPASLAHEYFNRSWWLTYFAELERTLGAASLKFACSAHVSDLAGEVRERLAGAGFLGPSLGVPLRETAADFVLNRRFRRDVFMRGSIRLSQAERRTRLDEVRFALLRSAQDVPMFMNTPYGQVAHEESRVKPLIEMLAASQQPVSFAQLRSTPEFSDWPAEDMLLTLTRLVASRDVCPVFADDAALNGDARAYSFNSAIAKRSRDENSVRYLASPVATSGVEANRYERLFWLSWQQGNRTPADLARSVSTVASDGHLGSAEELEIRATRFVSTVVPTWQRLGVLGNKAAKPRK